MGISTIAFLAWLKQRGALPSPKHLSQVKKLHRKLNARHGGPMKRKSKRLSHSMIASSLLPSLNEDEDEDNRAGSVNMRSHGAQISYLNLHDLKSVSPTSHPSGIGISRNFSVSSFGDTDADDDGASIFGSECDFDGTLSEFGAGEG
jgi:hypothetical protein